MNKYLMPETQTRGYFGQNRRNRGRDFDDAAEAAKHDMFPELYFYESEPTVLICRVCKGEGFHNKECGLKNPDGKLKANADDLIALAKDEPIAERKSIDVERQRLEKLSVTPIEVEAKKVAKKVASKVTDNTPTPTLDK